MKQSKLLALVIEALEDVKAQNICVYDTSNKTSAFDNVVICSGTSNRQTRALANSVVKTVKPAGFPVNGLEGTDTGEWVLVDCGSIVIHCMQPTIRQYYNLEELWGPETLDIEMLKKAALAAEEEAKSATVKTPKKRTTKKVAAAEAAETEKKAPAKKRTVKKAADSEEKAPAKKRTVKKAADTEEKAPAKKRTSTRQSSAKKTEVTDATVAKKRTTTRKTTAKKAQ